MKDFRYLDDTAILVLNEEACIGCKMCEIVCPHRIFKVENGKARITDKNACMECSACTRNCPTEAIYTPPDDGCGCALLIMQQWLAKAGIDTSDCGC